MHSRALGHNRIASLDGIRAVSILLVVFGHASLSVEEQFYVCWPSALRALGRARASHLALALIFLAPFLRIAAYVLLPTLRGRIPVMAHTRVDTLMFGCWLALAKGQLPFKGVLDGRLKSALPYLAIVVLALHTVCARRFTGRYVITVGLTIEGAAVTTMRYSVLADPTSRIARVLSLPPVAWLGRLSYSLYLWQQLFLTNRRLPGRSHEVVRPA